MMQAAGDQNRVTEFFEAHSESYGDFFKEDTRTGASEMFRARLAIVAELLAGKTGALLDCATGTGEITQAVNASGRYRQLWANDVSAAMLRVARQAIRPTHDEEQLHFINRDIFAVEQEPDLPLFDVILCLGLIAHVGRLDDLFATFARLLGPDGTVALQTSVADQLWVRVARVVNDRRIAAGKHHQIYYFDIPSIEAAAAKAGFRTVAVRRFGVALPFGDKWLGRINHWIERRFARGATRHGADAVLIFERRPA
ncbi:MAG: methyltransferase domain-containing protein [Pseudomonadota bacterium]